MGNRLGAHLTPEQIVDAADGVRNASVDAHLAACAACREQVSEFGSAMSSVEDAVIPVPEPSPLFWDRFQDRVVTAAIAEQQNESVLTRLVRSLQPSMLVPVAAAVTVAVAVLVINVGRGNRVAPAAPASASSTASTENPSVTRELLRDSMDDDPSLQLIADLAVDVDWNGSDAASLAPNGSADHAVSHMDARELAELQRLLRAELGT
jgi:hypothetical protein